MKDLFLLNYTFTLESEINGLSETEKKGLGKKLGQIFSKDLKKKIGVLEMWKYSHPFYEELILPFI